MHSIAIQPLYSVKAMLLLIDCKDLLLSNGFLNGHTELGLKKTDEVKENTICTLFLVFLLVS